MPAIQRGQVRKLAGGSWAYRYRDENGRRRQVGGFRTKGEASQALASASTSLVLGRSAFPAMSRSRNSRAASSPSTTSTR